MSEEEIIKIINEKIILDFNYYNPIDKIDLEAIQGLLNLYNKEKEKNKELEKGFNNAVSEQTKLTRENTKLRKENHELENADLTTVYMNGFYDGEILGKKAK